MLPRSPNGENVEVRVTVELDHDHAKLKILAGYWGKADASVAAESGHSHHSLLGHSLDVAACAYVLVDENSTLRRRLAELTGIPVDVVAITFATVCALHDIGKLDTRFQRKAPEVADALRPHTANIATGRYDHGSEGFRQIEDDDAEAAYLEKQIGAERAMPILRAVCGHHGAFPMREPPDASRSNLPRRVRKEDSAARRALQDCLFDFFSTLECALPWPNEADGALLQQLGGLCAVADWVGSNVEHFPYCSHELLALPAYWGKTLKGAHRACREAGLQRDRVPTRSFNELFPGYTPRDVQTLTEELTVNEAALVILEAEMCKGKTEAAYSTAARFLGAGLAEGITVALPTMATSNAMFSRVLELTPRLFPEKEVQLALAHSRARRQAPFASLLDHRLRASDKDAPEASVMCARWLLSRKRVLLAQLGVGTIDQALQAGLMLRHQFVRMFALARNVVIIDEVHAYDAYMEVLLEHLLSWLGALNVPVILLSATLPSARRTALANAWRGSAAAEQVDNDTVEQARKRPYPLVSVTTSHRTQILALTTQSENRKIAIRCVYSTDDQMSVTANQLLQAARAGARVVWIRNTVKEAQHAYQAVKQACGEIQCLLFHARFRSCDRSAIEEEVLHLFDKHAPSGGRVLIATQVVEQSLDLDFDLMHSDLAPIDLLFQRAGRLHRHQRARPRGCEEPFMAIHCPSVEDIAEANFGVSEYVYDKGTLWLAHKALRNRKYLTLPTDIRPLVEATYHPVARAEALQQGGSILTAAEEKLDGEILTRRTKAQRICIAPTDAEPDGDGALEDDDVQVQALTRDGISASLLPFEWLAGETRVMFADATATAWNMDASKPSAGHLVEQLLDQTLSIPAKSINSVQPCAPTGDESSWDIWLGRFQRFAADTGLGPRTVPLAMQRDGENYTGWLLENGTRHPIIYSRVLGFQKLSTDEKEKKP